jgi:Glycosyl hydrolases family 15
VCRRGFDPGRNSFVQSYGSTELDASLLRLPAVGFLPGTDPRITGTVSAIARELAVGDGLLLRYPAAAQGAVDGLAGGEGAFLACSFWLADALALSGRHVQARDLFERLLTLRNDVGLLAEFGPRLRIAREVMTGESYGCPSSEAPNAGRPWAGLEIWHQVKVELLGFSGFGVHEQPAAADVCGQFR